MKIGFVGGGSGGHFYPLIAVIEELKDLQPGAELYYFGPSPYNKELLSEHGVNYIYCPAGKLRRYFSFQNFIDIFRSFAGFYTAITKLYVIYPDVIFSKGGFTSVPVLLAARFLRIPVVIHESDAVPGKANKLAKSFARYIAIAYDDVADFFPKEKTALVGIPLRREIRKINANALQELGIPADKPLLYVTGGSLGAERINDIVLTSLGDLLPHYRIFHQTGESSIDTVRQTAQNLLSNQPDLLSNYYVEGTISAKRVSLLLDAASIIISRAGSTTLFEIATHSKPAIIIPIPEEVSHDQRTNAFTYASTGAASVIEEKNLTPHLLASEINSIINDQARYSSMKAAATELAHADAALKIAEILITIAKEHD